MLKTLKPTNKAVITKEGLQRKHARLMLQALREKHPGIHAQLEAEVNALIAFDQANPLSKVAGAHTGHESARFKAVQTYKREQLKEAVDNNFRAVRLPNLSVNYSVPDLIGNGQK